MTIKNTQFEIVPTQVDDATAIAAVVNQAWQHDLTDLISAEHAALFSESWFYQRTEADLSHNDSSSWVVHSDIRSGRQVVAYLCIRHHQQSDCGELFGLYVQPQCQGYGLGKQLFQLACDTLQRQGKKTMIVWTFDGANNNVFYRSFAPCEIRKRSLDIYESQYAGIGFVYSLDKGNQ